MKSKIIILSIHPQHIKKILAGEKLYEYRKQIPTEVEYVVVYATVPIKKIVAVIKVENILKDTPENIWIKTQQNSGVSYEFFMKYFTGQPKAYAIKFQHIYKLPQPMDITIIDGVKCAPQAYVYVNESLSALSQTLYLKI